jgi:hypothetical protein
MSDWIEGLDEHKVIETDTHLSGQVKRSDF